MPAEALYKHVYLAHRVIPKEVSSDRGTHFSSQLFVEFNKLFGSRQTLHTAYRPQSSGNLERAHRTMKSALFILAEERGAAWPDLLDEVVSNMNSLPNSATKLSPHFILTGREPHLGIPKPESSSLKAISPNAYANKLAKRLRQIQRAVKISADEADFVLDKKSKDFELKPLAEGDSVLLYRPQSSIAKSTKMDWIPGYEVILTNNMVVKLRNIHTNSVDWVHRHQVRKVSKRPDHLVDPPLTVPTTRGQGSDEVIEPVNPIGPLKNLPIHEKAKSPAESPRNSDIHIKNQPNEHEAPQSTREVLSPTVSRDESPIRDPGNFEPIAQSDEAVNGTTEEVRPRESVSNSTNSNSDNISPTDSEVEPNSGPNNEPDDVSNVRPAGGESSDRQVVLDSVESPVISSASSPDVNPCTMPIAKSKTDKQCPLPNASATGEELRHHLRKRTGSESSTKSKTRKPIEPLKPDLLDRARRQRTTSESKRQARKETAKARDDRETTTVRRPMMAPPVSKSKSSNENTQTKSGRISKPVKPFQHKP